MFKVDPLTIYEALMDSKTHSFFTGSEAKISRKVGGKFSVYNGYATGKNIELVPGKRIIQTWHASDWEKEAFSMVTFEFHQTKNGTELIFIHEGVPLEHLKSIVQGWKDFYWSPLKDLLNK